MLASLDHPPIARPGYVYEPKYDGIRALVDLSPAVRRGRAPHVAIYSRNGLDKTPQFPAIGDALARLASRLDGPVLLDGEIVAMDRTGRPLGFQALQGRIQLHEAADIARAESANPAGLVIFDLLRDADEDLRGEPLAARRLRLQARVRLTRADAPWLRLSELVADDGRALLERARAEGWEGLIVKDARSVYHSGRRTPAWRKLKLLSADEFVVGGWTAPRQSRTHFGALILGQHDAAGRLQWTGTVGTGFDERELARVASRLAPLAQDVSPFARPFKTMEPARWTRPELVVAVRFTERTSDGLLRHPVYLGVREDKAASDVRLPGAAPGGPAGETRGSRTRGRRPLDRALPDLNVTADPALAAAIARLRVLEDAQKDGDVELPGRHTLRVTNLAKRFWPALGITKGELMRYYVGISPWLLPAVDDRPLVMKRFPNGIEKSAFYQQRHPEAVPPGVRRERLPDEIDPIDEDGTRERLIGGSLMTLLYMTQLAAISQDPWFSRVADPLHADAVAIDLDPQAGAGFDRVLDVARWVKDELDRLDIPAVPKTSGSRGLHIYIPLPRHTTYDTGQLLCHTIATLVATAHPRVATIERMVRRRPAGTIYIDYLQNILGKTLATAYSARASDYAGVSTPLTWQEVAEGVDPRAFTIRSAPARFRDVGDLWKGTRARRRVNLRAVLARLARPARGR
jgi:bifunctional non-homologous end joining protein LigD